MRSVRELLHDARHRYVVLERDPATGEIHRREDYGSREHAEQAFRRAREEKRPGNSVGLCDTDTFLFLDVDAAPMDEFFMPPGGA